MDAHPTKLADTPLIQVGALWPELVDWHRRFLLRAGSARASEADVGLPRCVPRAVEALATVREHPAARARRARA